MTNHENKDRVLVMRDIYKAFGGEAVLKGISMEVSCGEVVAVIGRSGSGKSTLLRCATVLETVDAGEIRYGDKLMVTNDANGKACYAEKARLKDIRLCFGLVFQNFNLFPHFSVMQKHYRGSRSRSRSTKSRARKKPPVNSWRKWA